jgi:hypothetical protein
MDKASRPHLPQVKDLLLDDNFLLGPGNGKKVERIYRHDCIVKVSLVSIGNQLTHIKWADSSSHVLGTASCDHRRALQDGPNHLRIKVQRKICQSRAVSGSCSCGKSPSIMLLYTDGSSIGQGYLGGRPRIQRCRQRSRQVLLGPPSLPLQNEEQISRGY